jgi:acyl-CoA thioester hydrolase
LACDWPKGQFPATKGRCRLSANARRRAQYYDLVLEQYVHPIRPRYGEVDIQGVVFNARWMDYFDDAITQFFSWLGFPLKVVSREEHRFDMMLIKASLEWKGRAGLDDDVRIDVIPVRLGNSSFDVRFDAKVNGDRVCEALITYVAVKPGDDRSSPIPDDIRAKLTALVPE